MMNKMNILDFQKNIDFAANSIFSFSQFVKTSEFIFDDIDISVDEIKILKNKWFELEIINALALDEWESDGMPRKWEAKWKRKYKEEALQLINEFFTLVKEQIKT